MSFNRSMFSRHLKSGAGALAVATLGMAGAAHADNLTWSVGLSSPGVVLGVSNAQPVYVQPQRVYVQPQPVYVQPQPVYVQPRPVYVQPQVVYVQPAPQVIYPGWRHHPRHDRHDRHWDHRGPHQPTQYVQPVQYGPQVIAPQVIVPAPVYGHRPHWR
jgi:hypothetical protein